MRKTEILLIDELYFPKYIVRNLLSHYNLKIFEASTLAEGLELFLEIKPSVIIFGATMNDEASLNLSKTIREHCNTVKIIFLFNRAFRHTVADVFMSGGNRLFVCPLNRELLIEEIVPGSKTQEYPLADNF